LFGGGFQERSLNGILDQCRDLFRTKAQVVNQFTQFFRERNLEKSGVICPGVHRNAALVIITERMLLQARNHAQHDIAGGAQIKWYLVFR